MNPEEFGERAKRDLEPLLVAVGSLGEPARARRVKGGRDSPGNRPWVSIPGGLELSMTRSLPLTRWEAALLGPYGEALADLAEVPDAVARHAADDVALRAIASQLCGHDAPVVETAARFLLRRAGATYEGQPVRLNLLVDTQQEHEAPALGSLDELEAAPWHAVVGGGLATGIAVDSTSAVGTLIDLDDGLDEVDAQSLQPYALRAIGTWTSESPTRVSLSLTRAGEILIHQSGVLRYVYRASRWRGLPLEVATRGAWTAGSYIRRPVKRAVLASLIDASLAHHGACLAVVARGHLEDFAGGDSPVRPDDRWPGNDRSKRFGGGTFLSLTRRQRLEMLSMDGATVIDYRGRVLACGAIVQVPGGSEGGGRLAAAKALAKFGASLKVSQDGPVTLFGRSEEGEVEERWTLA